MIPERVKIGGLIFDVLERPVVNEDEPSRIGEVDSCSSTITLESSLPIHTKLTVLMHEVQHIVDWMTGSDLSHEETDGLSRILYSILYDNPILYDCFCVEEHQKLSIFDIITQPIKIVGIPMTLIEKKLFVAGDLGIDEFTCTVGSDGVGDGAGDGDYLVYCDSGEQVSIIREIGFRKQRLALALLMIEWALALIHIDGLEQDVKFQMACWWMTILMENPGLWPKNVFAFEELS